MSELEMKTEAEVEDFTDELSDEALDRAEGAVTASSYHSQPFSLKAERSTPGGAYQPSAP